MDRTRVIGVSGLEVSKQVVTDDIAHAIAEVVADRRRPYNLETPKRKKEYLLHHGFEVPDDADELFRDAALEWQPIGKENDIRSVSWLSGGRHAADSVPWIGTNRGTASGFMISADLLMTNHHVFATADDAADPSVQVLFNYETNADGSPTSAVDVTLDPDKFFLANERLDFAIVAVNSQLYRTSPGTRHGYLPLRGDAIIGSPVNIIQHPGGRPKTVAFRNNLLTAIKERDRIVYLTDTDHGSSGSPVLNDRWELVGLHSASQDAVGDDGRPIDIYGNPVTDDTPEKLRNWVANEGIRVSSIVKYLSGRKLRKAEAELLRAADILVKQRTSQK